MTIFNPVWQVTIGGVQYQTAILANLTNSSGRRNIYEQAQAGYTNLEIVNLNQTNVPIEINDSITIELPELNDEVIIEIQNMLGELVYSLKGRFTKQIIDMNKFQNGIYSFRLSSSESHYLNKIVVQK